MFLFSLGSTEIRIDREACCAADDYRGPLTMTLRLRKSATLRKLAERIRDSRFLQFTGTCPVAYGRSGTDQPLFAIDSGVDGEAVLIYYADRDTPIRDAVANGKLSFRFR